MTLKVCARGIVPYLLLNCAWWRCSICLGLIDGFVIILLEKKSPHHSLGAPQDVENHQAYLKLHVLFQSQQTTNLHVDWKSLSNLFSFQSFLPEETLSLI